MSSTPAVSLSLLSRHPNHICVTFQCSLAQSRLTDSIHLAVDSSRQRILSISSFPLTNRDEQCQPSALDGVILDEFNTTVRLVDVVDGPM